MFRYVRVYYWGPAACIEGIIILSFVCSKLPTQSLLSPDIYLFDFNVSFPIPAQFMPKLINRSLFHQSTCLSSLPYIASCHHHSPLLPHLHLSAAVRQLCVCTVCVCGVPACVWGCPHVCRVDGAQLSELSITLPEDEIRMFRGHTAPIWHSADKSAASTGVCVWEWAHSYRFMCACTWRLWAVYGRSGVFVSTVCAWVCC